MIDIMRTHPMIIIGGILQENPVFVPPKEFLRELHERRAKQSKGRSTAAEYGNASRGNRAPSALH